jgi:hypothetical protein
MRPSLTLTGHSSLLLAARFSYLVAWSYCFCPMDGHIPKLYCVYKYLSQALLSCNFLILFLSVMDISEFSIGGVVLDIIFVRLCEVRKRERG